MPKLSTRSWHHCAELICPTLCCWLSSEHTTDLALQESEDVTVQPVFRSKSPVRFTAEGANAQSHTLESKPEPTDHGREPLNVYGHAPRSGIAWDSALQVGRTVTLMLPADLAWWPDILLHLEDASRTGSVQGSRDEPLPFMAALSSMHGTKSFHERQREQQRQSQYVQDLDKQVLSAFYLLW